MRRFIPGMALPGTLDPHTGAISPHWDMRFFGTDPLSRLASARQDDEMKDITRVLSAIERGEEHAADELIPLVYDELRRLAAQKLARERPGQTLQPTALVHEAYMRVMSPGDPGWDGRAHFFAAAAEAMRRILIDKARRKARLKHGGDWVRSDLDEVDAVVEPPSEDILALDAALTKLAQEDPVKAKLVKLRYFTGLTIAEASQCLDISPATAERYWAYARAWLYEEMRGA